MAEGDWKNDIGLDPITTKITVHRTPQPHTAVIEKCIICGISSEKPIAAPPWVCVGCEAAIGKWVKDQMDDTEGSDLP
jgi:hypothetical protein